MHLQTEFCFDFIRHGQSAAQLQSDLIGGRTPPADLTPLGIRQINALGDRLRQEGVDYDEVYTSPLLRAVETALSTCLKIGIYADRIRIVPALMELDQGQWEGRKRDEVLTTEEQAYASAAAPWFTPPGGESQQTVQRRMADWLEREFLQNKTYRQAGKTWHFGIFGHGTAFRCLFQAIMGFNSELIWRGLYLENCSLSRFSFNRHGWSVHSLNDVGHLVGLRS